MNLYVVWPGRIIKLVPTRFPFSREAGMSVFSDQEARARMEEVRKRAEYPKIIPESQRIDGALLPPLPETPAQATEPAKHWSEQEIINSSAYLFPRVPYGKG